jgi:glycosyltransferase involved in cell wall biosynthesis
MSKISVVIPTYKRIERLKKAIQSVLNQSVQDFEIIVSNDSIEDSSALESLIKQFGDDRIKLINNFRQKGGCGARNSGILTAQGEYIAFLDDDDFFYPDALAMHMEAFNNNDAVMVVGECKLIDEIFGDDKVVARNSQILKFDVLVNGYCPASTSMVVVKKEALIQVGLFDETLPSYQDYDMWLKISGVGLIQEHAGLVTGFVQHEGDRTSINIEKRLNGLRLLVKKWSNAIAKVRPPEDFEKQFTADAYFKMGTLLTSMGIEKKLTSIRYFLKAVSLQANNIHYWKWLFLGIAGPQFIKYMKGAKSS